MLEPLLKDLASLEKEGLYIPFLGRPVKGTVCSVVADNLGAHSIGGFVEFLKFISLQVVSWRMIPPSFKKKKYEEEHFLPGP